MNVLLLGNGFDLNYHLPTKYINFLNTVQYLSTGPWFDIHTVGDVFGSPKLQKMDKDIAKSYKKYKEAYDSIPLPREIISDLAELAENPWYSYFSDSLNKEMGWIDFEKEIQKVIKGFQKLFQKDSLITCFDFSDKTTSIFEKMLVSKFGFFLEIPDNMGGYGARFSVREDFLIEEPVGTNLFTLNREKVVNYLYMALQILAQKLQVYLYVFIDRAVHSLATNN